jgi:hypothetical protein
LIAVSVLDLAPVTEGSDPSRAFANALDLARHAERLHSFALLAESVGMPN